MRGFACTRSEVSGRRLWGWFARRFGTAEAFFRDHLVANWCPLAFVAASGANLTPDRLPAEERSVLAAACDRHLRIIVEILRPQWVVGIGGFARARCAEALAGLDVRIGSLLHPSPASPAANRGWEAAAEKDLSAQGVW